MYLIIFTKKSDSSHLLVGMCRQQCWNRMTGMWWNCAKAGLSKGQKMGWNVINYRRKKTAPDCTTAGTRTEMGFCFFITTCVLFLYIQPSIRYILLHNVITQIWVTQQNEPWFYLYIINLSETVMRHCILALHAFKAMSVPIDNAKSWWQ